MELKVVIMIITISFFIWIGFMHWVDRKYK